MHAIKNLDKTQQDKELTEAKGWGYLPNVDKHLKKNNPVHVLTGFHLSPQFTFSLQFSFINITLEFNLEQRT